MRQPASLPPGSQRRPAIVTNDAAVGFRFSGRVSIVPGLRVNLGKSGASLSIDRDEGRWGGLW